MDFMFRLAFDERGVTRFLVIPLSLGGDSEIYWKEFDFAVLPWMRGGNQILWTSLVTPLSLGEDPEIC